MRRAGESEIHMTRCMIPSKPMHFFCSFKHDNSACGGRTVKINTPLHSLRSYKRSDINLIAGRSSLIAKKHVGNKLDFIKYAFYPANLFLHRLIVIPLL